MLGIKVIDFGDSTVKVPERIEELCPGGVDVAIEAVGFRFPKSILHKIERALMFEFFQSVRKYGCVSIIGDYIGYAHPDAERYKKIGNAASDRDIHRIRALMPANLSKIVRIVVSRPYRVMYKLLPMLRSTVTGMPTSTGACILKRKY